MSSFSERLKKVMDDNAISQVMLCERSGISPMTISHYVCGRRKPTIENLARILNALWFVDARWLITGAIATSKGRCHE